MQNTVDLRLMTEEDTDRIVAWRNKDFVQTNFIYQEPFTREGHLSWIRNQVEKGHVVQFIICLPDGREIGSVYFRDIDRDKGTAEYGIYYAFTKLSLRKIYLRFLADNTAARKSYEHAGFVMTDRKETVMTKQGRREVFFMEIDRERYMAMREAETGQ